MKHEPDTVVRSSLPDLSPIPIVSEVDAAPSGRLRWTSLAVVVLLSLGLWGVIWALVAAFVAL